MASYYSPSLGSNHKEKGTSQIPILSMKNPTYANDVGEKKGTLGLAPRNHGVHMRWHRGAGVTCTGFRVSPELPLAHWVSLGQ